MPRRNYRQTKREREASRDKRKADKLERKHERADSPPDENTRHESGAADEPSEV